MRNDRRLYEKLDSAEIAETAGVARHERCGIFVQKVFSNTSPPWMKTLMHRLETAFIHMGINLGGDDIRMSKHHLHRT